MSAAIDWLRTAPWWEAVLVLLVQNALVFLVAIAGGGVASDAVRASAGC